MNNTKFFTILALVLISFGGFSQSKRKADKLFKINKWAEALNMYKELDNPNQDVLANMAYSQKKLFKYKEAEDTYNKFINNANVSDQAYFEYADILNTLGNYSKAIEYYGKVSGENRSKMNIDKRISNCNWAKNNANTKSSLKLVLTNIETGGISFGNAPYQGGIVYSYPESSRNDKTGEVTRFYNLGYSKKISQTNFSAPEEFSSAFNSEFYEGSPSFTENEIYFTRNNSEKEQYRKKKRKKFKISTEGVNTLSIYTASKNGSKWSKPTSLAFNSSEYSCTHPSITKDGNTLYFASDMPGGFGGYDIYVVTKSNSGSWSSPKNLGPTVNTKGTESFPFIFGDKLYFSSREHPGYGGLDVFISENKEGVWTTPENAGLGVNTSKDDFGMYLNADGKTGYMSSNREGGNGYDYIYNVIPALEMDSVLTTITSGYDGTPIAKPTLRVKNTKTGEYTIDGKNGEITTRGPKKGKTTYIYDADGYDPVEITLDEFDKNKLSNIKLDPRLRGTVTNGLSDEAVEGVKVLVKDAKTGEIISSTITGKDGKWAFVLPEDREYDIVFEKEGFTKESIRVKPSDSADDIKVNLRDLALKPSTTKGDKVEIRNIYFKHASYKLEASASKTLDKIVQFLEDNPKVRIELSAHTDMVGPEKYNRRLSDKRAKSATKYIIRKGISKSRIVGKGYGEKYILNRCTSYREKCSEEEYAVSRRVEVKIL